MTKAIRLLLVLLLLVCLLAACIHTPDLGADTETEARDPQATASQTAASSQTTATTVVTTAPASKEEATQPGDPYWSNEAEDGQTKRY